eukprot:2262649-Pleurochrysis_carterae.AAC.1
MRRCASSRAGRAETRARSGARRQEQVPLARADTLKNDFGKSWKRESIQFRQGSKAQRTCRSISSLLSSCSR